MLIQHSDLFFFCIVKIIQNTENRCIWSKLHSGSVNLKTQWTDWKWENVSKWRGYNCHNFTMSYIQQYFYILYELIITVLQKKTVTSMWCLYNDEYVYV